MKTPSWEPSAGALAAWLAQATRAVPVDLYTITLKSGTVLRYTSGEVPLTVNGNTYTVGPGLKRTRTKQSIGITVDTMSIEVYGTVANQVNGLSIISSIALGYFDGALVQLDHAFYDETLALKGVVPTFQGKVGLVTTERGHAALEIRSSLELLDIQIPGDIYQPACRNTLYDAYCTVNKGSRTVTVAVDVNPARGVFFVRYGTPTPWDFELGVGRFQNGANAGVARTIKSAWIQGSVMGVEFVSPFPGAINPGETIDLSQGCKKTMERCQNQFGNLVNFRGEPFIPAPETVT